MVESVASIESLKREAESLLKAQRLPEARVAFSRLCQRSPDDYRGWLNLGAVEAMLGMFEAAKIAFQQALTLCDDEPVIYFNLARLSELQGQSDEAIHYLNRYLQLKPDDASGYAEIGALLHKVGRLPEAAEAMREAVQRNPQEVEYYNNLGVMLGRLGRYDEALENYQHVLRLRPEVDGVYCNIANLYHNMGRGELARANFARALEINPLNASAHMNLGFHHARSGNNGEAMCCFRRALQLAPDNAAAHFNMALLLLLQGEFDEGWREYEWRFQCDEIKRRDIIARYTSKPVWSGAPLTTERLFVYVEQGFGDALQFCRYLPLVAQRVRHLVVECHAEMVGLLRAQFGAIEFIARPSDGALPAVSYDVQVPLMSLPRLLGTETDSVVRCVPYIHADPRQVEAWRQRLNSINFKVGLVWAGSPDHRRDHKRSLSLSVFELFAEIDGVEFYSLQKGPAAAEAITPPSGICLVDLSAELDDFSVTAAVIANLDLVITVDTAVAHLAGAMGKQVWTLIYSPPDWRWLLDVSHSPWYPTMRLFREGAEGGWGAVIESVAMELQKIVPRNIATDAV